MKPIIEVRNLTKSFRRGEYIEYGSVRDSITQLFSSKKPIPDDFNALSEVSFDVYPGEALGIIGKNGAGKSTLLKVLSRITPPTKGHVLLRGTLSSLLEVGTGFHSELTGRENIFFNGTLLGLSKSEINTHFDSIVEFSGVKEFIDTPLKRYSSGMSVRLAFSVAAHLNPDILIVDEVLAVGDLEFQKKCIRKMEEVRTNGKTVIFVSHQMSMIEKLCSRAIILSKGQIIQDGKTTDVIKAYMDQNDEMQKLTGFEQLRKPFSPLYCQRLEFLNENQQPSNLLKSGNPTRIRVHYECPEEITSFSFWIYVYDKQYTIIAEILSATHKFSEVRVDQQKKYFDILIPSLPFIPGTYTMTIVIRHKLILMDEIEQGVVFDVVYDDYFGTKQLPSLGVLFPYEFQF